MVLTKNNDFESQAVNSPIEDDSLLFLISKRAFEAEQDRLFFILFSFSFKWKKVTFIGRKVKRISHFKMETENGVEVKPNVDYLPHALVVMKNFTLPSIRNKNNTLSHPCLWRWIKTSDKPEDFCQSNFLAARSWIYIWDIAEHDKLSLEFSPILQ